MVQHKNTKTLFALKYINKPKCVKMKAVANIVQERRLLEEVCPSVRASVGERLFRPGGLLKILSKEKLTSDRPPIRSQSTIRISR